MRYLRAGVDLAWPRSKLAGRSERRRQARGSRAGHAHVLMGPQPRWRTRCEAAPDDRSRWHPADRAARAAPPARAEIAGEQVVSGTATFEQSGNVTTIHASDGAIINYSQFDIWANEELHFVQPSSEVARAQPRVRRRHPHRRRALRERHRLHREPGRLFFGRDRGRGRGRALRRGGRHQQRGLPRARSTASRSPGSVENAGSIESPAVALLGTAVANHGKIHAPDGTIALVAGEKVLLTQLGAHLAVEVEGAGGQRGRARDRADRQRRRRGRRGLVHDRRRLLARDQPHRHHARPRDRAARARAAPCRWPGRSTRAIAARARTGGSIAVTGERVALLGAQLDASGDAGGGEIRVGGDLHGEGALPTARRTYVDEESALRADAISRGRRRPRDRVGRRSHRIPRRRSRRAAAPRAATAASPRSRARRSSRPTATSISRAASGATGTLLYDPKDIVLHAGTLDGSDAPDASDAAVSGPSLGQVLFGTPDELDDAVRRLRVGARGHEREHRAPGDQQHQLHRHVRRRGSLDGNSLTMQTRNNTGDELGTSLRRASISPGVSFQTGGTGAITLATGTRHRGGGTGRRRHRGRRSHHRRRRRLALDRRRRDLGRRRDDERRRGRDRRRGRRDHAARGRRGQRRQQRDRHRAC